jgi:hypothetical protein
MAKEDEPMDEQTNGMKEIGINKPTRFNGDQKKIKNFLNECILYLTVNERIHDTDAKKIAFILSYMTEKEALLWKQQYLERTLFQADGTITWPTFKSFYDKIKADFKYEDQIRTAMNQLETIRQGG